MNASIMLWIKFLELSLILLTPKGRDSVFHHKHHPCSNTAGDILFEFSFSFQVYFNFLTQKYLEYSNDRGPEGELDFIFDTLTAREDEGLNNNLWITKVTEVEKMSRDEILDFTIQEVTIAVIYFRECFKPEISPWETE